MSARGIVITKLVQTPAIIALLGGNKIWPDHAPQGTTAPYILVHKPAQTTRQLLEGPSCLVQSRVSLECIAASAAAADALGDALYAALGSVTNELIESAGSPTEISRTATIMSANLDTTDYSDDRTVHRRIIDFYVDWR